MDVKIEKGQLVISIPWNEKGYKTDKGNTVHASSHGNQEFSLAGKVVRIGVNAFVKGQ